MDGFFDGLGKVALGVEVILATPMALGVVTSIAATGGALAITAGLATEVAVVTSGVTAMTVAETSLFTAGAAIATKGAREMAS